MPFTSRFSRRPAPVIPSARPSAEIVRVDMRGLDKTTPLDVMEQNRTPRARNFRIYAEEQNDRRVTVSNRKGAGFYTTPIGETLDIEDTDTTGQADAEIGVFTKWKAMRVTPSVSGRLTKAEITIKSVTGGKGPIVIEFRNEVDGRPGELLATSGILPSGISDSAYTSTPIYFLDAPEVTATENYYLIAHIQDDGEGTYYWRSNTATQFALTSNSGGLSWDAATYSLNFKLHISPATPVKGIARFAPESGLNRTLMAVDQNMYYVTDGTGATTSIVGSLNASATDYYFAYMDGKTFWVNGYDTLRTWNGTTHAAVTHTQLPVLSLMCAHKNRIFGVSASDKNKLVFSEDPDNDDGAGNEWYNAWLSTSYIYIPSPKASEPITAIVPFQDNLVVFTRSSKYILYGSDPGSFTVRQSTGNKGALHQKGVYADENYIYFVANDGFYRWNGSEDEIISDPIQTTFDSISDPSKVAVTKYQRQIRFYYPSSGSAYNDSTAIYHTVLKEWMEDTETPVGRAVIWNDADDPRVLVEASSLVGAAYYAEQDDNALGKAIDFVYDCKPDSMGNPAKKKRVNKLFPLIEGENGNYFVEFGVNKDRQDTQSYRKIYLTSEGPRLGEFTLGDGTVLGGGSEYDPKRFRVSGYAKYFQLRLRRKAINNPVNFIGYVLSYREKRL